VTHFNIHQGLPRSVLKPDAKLAGKKEGVRGIPSPAFPRNTQRGATSHPSAPRVRVFSSASAQPVPQA
jgi:hypothetical protein